MTELRRRMLEELRLRNYSPHTQRAYIRCLANFAKHFGTAPDPDLTDAGFLDGKRREFSRGTSGGCRASAPGRIAAHS